MTTIPVSTPTVVYPPKDHASWEDSSFVTGWLPPTFTGSVCCNNQPLSEWQHDTETGFFTAFVPLAIGHNHITFMDNSGTEVLSHTITRHPLPTLENPQTQAMWAFPQEAVRHGLHDTLTLSCAAPAGAIVECHITLQSDEPPQSLPPLALHPRSVMVDTRHSQFAQLYQGDAPFPNDAQLYSAQFKLPFHITHDVTAHIRYQITVKSQTYTITPQGSLSLSHELPYLASLNEVTLVQTAPNHGSPYLPRWLANTPLLVRQQQGKQACVALNAHTHGWLPMGALTEPSAVSLPYPAPVGLRHLHVSTNTWGQITLLLPVSHPVPLQWLLNSQQATITVYGLHHQCDFIAYDPSVWDAGLNTVTIQPLSDDMQQIVVQLDQPLWGAYLDYDDEQQGLMITLRTRQSALKRDPCLVLIDPGHGGDELGACAPNGLPEKALNYAIAEKLAHRLAESSTLQPILTRQIDQAMSLHERQHLIFSHCPLISLSIHHNALPDGRNPLKERGICTFYSHPFALPLARSCQSTLVAASNLPDYGVLMGNFALCRPSICPSLLLELGFLTHPEDAKRCLDPAHQDRVVDALVNWLKALAAGE